MSPAEGHRARSRAILLTMALVVGGCEAGESQSAIPTGSAAHAVATPRVAIIYDTPLFEPVVERPIIGAGPCEDFICPVEEVTSEAIADLDLFWAAEMAVSFPDQLYSSPLNFYPYGQGEVPPSACAIGSAPEDVDDNAFFCSGSVDGREGPSISWYVPWLNDGLASYGDFYPVTIIAHEWGHHISWLLRQAPAGQLSYTVQQELQADCFAGIYTLGAGASGAFEFDPSDINEATAFFQNTGDDPSYPWFYAQAHGTSEQRVQAFNTGLLGTDASVCADYTTFASGPVYSVGTSFTIATLNTADVTLQTDGVTVDVRPSAGSAVRSNLREMPALAGMNPAEQLLSVMGEWGGDQPMTIIGEAEDFSDQFALLTKMEGQATGITYRQTLGDGTAIYGFFVLAVPVAGSALVIDTWIPGEPPASFDDWTDILAQVLFVYSGLRHA